MFSRWWEYERKVAKRAFKEVNLKTFVGWGFIIGILAYGLQMEAGLRTRHDTLVFVLIAFGCASTGALCAYVLKLFALPAKMADEEREKYDAALKSHADEKTKLTVSHNDAIRQLQNENQRLKREIDDESLKLAMTGSLSFKHFQATLTVNAVNNGPKPVYIKEVAIFTKPVPVIHPNGQSLTPVEALVLMRSKQPVTKIEPDGGMEEWKLALTRQPDFLVHEKDGQRYGSGHAELTSGKRVDFTFILFPDALWNQLGVTLPNVQ